MGEWVIAEEDWKSKWVIGRMSYWGRSPEGAAYFSPGQRPGIIGISKTFARGLKSRL